MDISSLLSFSSFYPDTLRRHRSILKWCYTQCLTQGHLKIKTREANTRSTSSATSQFHSSLFVLHQFTTKGLHWQIKFSQFIHSIQFIMTSMILTLMESPILTKAGVTVGRKNLQQNPVEGERPFSWTSWCVEDRRQRTETNRHRHIYPGWPSERGEMDVNDAKTRQWPSSLLWSNQIFL